MTRPGTDRIPMILDVDTGIDDALALATAVNSPRIDLLAVTTVAGNVDVGRSTANTLDVLSFLGHDEVPVHRGASRPLAIPHRGASYAHGADGLGGASFPASGRRPQAAPGPATMIRLARERPGEITLVAVGPLTNVAIALNVAPDLVDLIPRLVIMGGAVRCPGNVTPHAEFNSWADPHAAEQVLGAGFPDITLVGLDVTTRVLFSRELRDRLAAGQRTSRSAELAVRVGSFTFEERGLDGMQLHDPLTVAVTLDPTLIATEAVTVAVTTAGDEAGRTRITGPGQVRVAVDVDVERYIAAFQRLLLGEPVT